MSVPNLFPTVPTNKYRIAVIGEAPGRDEELIGKPFMGASGKLLKDILNRVGLPSDTLFFGNVCQERPINNDITTFEWSSWQIQSGLAQLAKDLEQFNPHLCILLGKTALYAATNRGDITNQRGSFFVCNQVGSPFLGRKCLPTYHPAAILRTYEWRPFLVFDLAKVVVEGQTPHWSPPFRESIICKTTQDVAACLSNVEKAKCGTDIEGYVNDMHCIGIADSPSKGFVIPFKNQVGESFWSLEDELLVWRLLSSWLESPLSSKVWQNGLYDRFILQWTYKIIPRNNTDDTMLQWHEKYCELPKSLATMTSVLTREPFYKQERKSEDWETKLKYCVKDACVTLECHEQLAKSPSTVSTSTTQSVSHYCFNRDILNPLLYMELRGMAYDTQKARERREKILKEMYEAQYELDKITDFGHGCKTKEEATQKCVELMCYKRDKTQVREVFKEIYPQTRRLIDTIFTTSGDGLNNISLSGELSSLLNTHNNVDSPKFTSFLYNKLALPLQINKKTKQPTADKLALLKLWKKTQNPVTKYALEIRKKQQHLELLDWTVDKDGRMRCAYNQLSKKEDGSETGTGGIPETGRLSCSTSLTGSGGNLQTVPSDDRDLYKADEGHLFFQCDLEGADSWTVAAWCKFLGDPTMFDDLIAGLKPARILTLLKNFGTIINSKTRPELKELSKTIDKKGIDYYACKQGTHGSCYLMGDEKLSDTIFKKSLGEIYISPTDCANLQRLFFSRYRGVKLWHDYIKRHIEKNPVMHAASGLTRRFFGRRDQILGEALAFEPQSNTTYATNKAMLNLWNDEDNRVEESQLRVLGDLQGRQGDNESQHGSNLYRRRTPFLRIEPLHQIHDAICGQFRSECQAWAIDKVKSYFNFPLTIANQQITIPFEMGVGPSWGELKEVK